MAQGQDTWAEKAALLLYDAGVKCFMLKGEGTCREYYVISVSGFLLVKPLSQDFSGAYHPAQY